MRPTDKSRLEFGRYDEQELVEMVDNDLYGASTPTIIASIGLSVASAGLSVAVATATQVCPTTTCTDSC